MIPKIVHFCWFGPKPLPRLARKCIASWQKFLPDYEIKLWNEENFNVNCNDYCNEAYKAGKYAFVSDFARFQILYEQGGIYFDTDVEVLRPLDSIIKAGPFMGCENEYNPSLSGISLGVNPGLIMGVEKGNTILKDLLCLYEKEHFHNADGTLNLTTVVERTTALLCHKGLQNLPSPQTVNDLTIYPKEYFCPLDYVSGKKHYTPNTFTVHHYMESWKTPGQRFTKALEPFLGKNFVDFLRTIKNKFIANR